jgi:hypothetical protein
VGSAEEVSLLIKNYFFYKFYKNSFFIKTFRPGLLSLFSPLCDAVLSALDNGWDAPQNARVRFSLDDLSSLRRSRPLENRFEVRKKDERIYPFIFSSKPNSLYFTARWLHGQLLRGTNKAPTGNAGLE